MNSTIKSFFIIVGLSLLTIMGLVAYQIIALGNNGNDISQIEFDRHNMYKKANELRQSSDDLTRYAREYIITGDIQYRDRYFKILDIRGGIAPKPKDYDAIYWDLLDETRESRHPLTKPISIIQEFSKLPYTKYELEKLRESIDNSDKLVNIEMEAFLAMEGIYKESDGRYIKNAQPSREYAIWLLYSEKYDKRKEKIMLPIDQFISSLNSRTQKDIEDHASETTTQFRKIYILFTVAYIIFFIVAIIINKRILTPIERLTKTISDFKDRRATRSDLQYCDNEIGFMAKQFFIMKGKLDDDLSEIKILTDRMKLALTGSKTAVLDLDFKYNNLYISPNWKEMLGYRDSELSNTLEVWLERVHEDDRIEVLDLLHASHKEQTSYIENSHRLQHRDRSWIWVQWRALISHDDSDDRVRMVGTHTDITKEKELHLKYSHLAHMIEQIHDSVISTDLDGIITSWNSVSETILGYTSEQMVGKEFSSIFPREEHQKLKDSITALLSHGSHQTIIKLLTSSEKTIDVDLSLSLLHNERGEAVGMVGYSKDITTNLETQRALKTQHRHLQAIIDGVNDPIMVIKEDYSVALMNEAVKKNIGHATIKDPQNPKCYEVSHYLDTPCDGIDHPCPLKMVLKTEQCMTVVHDHCHTRGSGNYLELSVSPLFDETNICAGIIEVARDITSHIEAKEKLEQQKIELHHQAHHDSLTQLPNRTLFEMRLKKAIESSDASGYRLALLFIDLDHFKEINDTLGHAIGDEVLRIVSNRMRASLKTDDTLARLGGDEFTLIVKDIDNSADIDRLAQRILDRVAVPMVIEGQDLSISCTIGISIYPDKAGNLEDLIISADKAMYRVKKEGRGGFGIAL